MSENNVDVLIVGAGPVGLFCANEVTRHGLTCRIIDKKSTITNKSKALGIHIRTLDVLEDCGLIDEFLRQGQPILGMTFKSNGKELFRANFEGVTGDRHFLIDLPQNQTEAILYQHLQNKSITVEWETELTQFSQSQNGVSATIKKQDNPSELINAKWLIACDGSHSTTRHLLNAEFKGSSYQEAWWLADVLIDWNNPDNQMSLYISDKGPLACFPMGNKRHRIVMIAPKNGTDTPSLADIEREFKLRSSDSAILSNPVWITQFSIHHRQIQQYRYDKVFIAGDAAHIHSPMGGQGLNTGIQDIYNLVWKIALVEKNKAKQELLDSYHAERFPIGHEVLKKTDILTRMILLTNPLAITLRNFFIQTITSFKKIRNFLANDIAELNISYAKSPIVSQSSSLKKLSAGKFLPNFQLVDSETQKATNRNAIIQGTLHHLVIFMGEETGNIAELVTVANSLAEQYAQTVQVHLVVFNKIESPTKSIKIWLDTKKQVHQDFAITEQTLLLVRPDKYIGILQTPINKDELVKRLYLLV